MALGSRAEDWLASPCSIVFDISPFAQLALPSPLRGRARKGGNGVPYPPPRGEDPRVLPRKGGSKNKHTTLSVLFTRREERRGEQHGHLRARRPSPRISGRRPLLGCRYRF